MALISLIPSFIFVSLAVGLYQRDDRVTLCTVSKPNVCRRGLPTSSLSLPCGDLYFPALSNNEEEKYNLFVRSWNQTLCFDGVSFATEILGRAIQQLMSCDSLLTTGDVLLTEILPCLASSICLIPSCIPTLSVQYAMELLPFITRCAKAIDNFIQSKDSPIGINMREGEWSIFTSSASEGTSTLSGSSKRSLESSEEYAVNIQPKIMQHEATEYFSYEGKSLNNEMTVIGASYGSRVYLVENTCTPESQKRERTSRGETAQISSESCIIDARLSLDGASFEGVRYRVEKGSSDRVSGFLQQPSVTKASDPNDLMKHLIQSECLLSLAVGHLSLILCSQTSMSDIYNDVGNNVEKKSLDSLLSRSLILSRGLLDYNRSSQRRAVHSTWDRCKSGNTHSEIRDHWEDTIYNDLLRPADKLKDNTMKMEDAMTILEQQTTTSWADRMGSLSRLCPEKYATAQKSIASAIFYHTYRSSSDSMPDIVSKAIQYSLPILENGVREALIRAGDGVRFNSVCEDHCSLLVLIAQFLFEFSCLADTNLSTHCVLDDIALITKSIHSEEDLNYIKQKMRVRTEQSIMQCVGLRSLHFLLQPEVGLKGVCVHVAVEAALVSLPRLLCSSAMELSSDLQHNHEPSNHFSSRIAGCTDTIQSLIHLGIRNIYAHVGSIFKDSVYQVTKSSTLGLLACCFSDVHPNEYYDIVLNVLPSLRVMSDRCRKQIMNTGTNLLDIICNHENQRLLETSAAILMVACYQLSHSSSNSSGVDVLNENLIHEIIETIVLVIEDATMISECEEKQAVLSDWITCHTSLGSKPATTHPAVAAAQESSKNLSERIVATLNRAVQSEAQSAVYLTQVLDVLHVAINTQSIIPGISKKSGALLSSLGFIVTIGGEGSDSSPTMHRLPLRFKRRLLRLLRPILLATNADSSVIRQLFFMAGTNVQGTRIAVLSSEDMLISQSSISLLRHLYMFSSSWRHVIHQHMTARDSDELLHGILTFIGGAPGSLVHGGFVVIDTEAASLSSSKVGSTKTRQSNELAGIHLNAISTSGVGAEEIAVGLRRHNSLSGVVSSIDSQHGTCEVILLDPNRSESNSTTRETRTITRAIHVSAAHVSAADELPLYIDATNLPAMDIFIQLSDTFKHISTIISSKSHNPGSAITQDTDAHALMECSQGLRSITVLTSEPKLLHKYVGHESGRLRFLLAQA